MLTLSNALNQFKKSWVDLKSSSCDIIRHEVEIAPIDLLAWLAAQDAKTKIFWQDRDQSLQIASVGEAAIFDEYPSQRHVNIRLWGGMAFEHNHPLKGVWKNFGSQKFILPIMEIIQEGSKTRLAIQCLNSVFSKTKAYHTLHAIKDSFPKIELKLPLPENRLDTPSQLLWERHVLDLLERIQKEHIKKSVLAREVQLQFKEEVNPFSLLANLSHMAVNSTCFLFQTQGDTFLGATPERLFKRHGRVIETEAIAGTRPEGRSKEEDEQLCADLRTSQKDLREHQFVTDMIKENLKEVCRTFSQDEQPQLLNLNGGHHLLTRFQGELKPEMTDADIIKCLHPTPAVAGTPTLEALNLIRQYENFSRGWYAGLFGYLSPTDSEFCVAIRSALLRQNTLSIYAGAGIVKDSNPSLEWQETENKMINFLKIFNANHSFS